MLRHGEPYVFLSHSSGDAAESQDLVRELETHGVNVWIDTTDIVPGKSYPEQIEAAIEHCGAFIIVLSGNANASKFVKSETEMAYGGGVPIFPLRIEEVKPGQGLGLFLNVQHWTDAFGPSRSLAVARLADAIKLELATEAPPPPLPIPIRPQQAAQPAPRPAPAVQPATRMGLMQPQAHPQTQPQGAIGPIDEETAIRTFVGERAPHFLEIWRRLNLSGSKVAFNIPVFFCGLFWFAYRKMYKHAGIALGLTLVLLLFNMIGEQNGETGSVALVTLLSLGMGLALALFANHWYRQHVLEQIARHNRPGENQQTIRDRLTMYGGTSILAVFGFGGAFLVGILFIAGVADGMTGQSYADTGAADVEMPAEAAAAAAEDAVDSVKN
jgi:TIR domain/Protein of unknown function (DUF2628)